MSQCVFCEAFIGALESLVEERVSGWVAMAFVLLVYMSPFL